MHFHRYRRRIHRLLPVLDRILRTGRYPNNFPRTNRQNPGIQTPGMARRHNNCNEKGLGETRNGSSRNDEKLKNAGYRLNLKKCEFFRKEIKWVGNKIDQHGILPLQDKLEAITKIDTPKNEKELKSFLGHYNTFRIIEENLSANTDTLRKLLKKNNEWNWTEEHANAFNKLKEYIINIPCLAHYKANSETILTANASKKGLGATLWQRPKGGNLKPVGYASRFLTDTEKKYAINEIELLAVVWGLEHFRLHIYGSQIDLLTDHQALEPLIKRNRSNKTYSARLTRWLDRLAHFDEK